MRKAVKKESSGEVFSDADTIAGQLGEEGELIHRAISRLAGDDTELVVKYWQVYWNNSKQFGKLKGVSAFTDKLKELTK